LEPTKTSFLQALNIPTKINKGTIEILSDVHLIKKGDKVGSSESTLLQMLDIRPFQYGLQMVAIYEEGYTIDSAIIEQATDEMILSKFLIGIGNVASLSLGVTFPSVASFPHVVLNGFKNLLAISLGTEYQFDQANAIKEMIANPGAFVQAAPAAQTSSTNTSKPEPEPEPEPEPDDDDAGLEFDIFG